MSQKSMASLVATFNATVLGKQQPDKIQNLSDAEYILATKQLNEEISEFAYADETDDIAGAADAMLDLIYFALGVLYKMGFPPIEIDAMFTVVHHANLTKTKGVKTSRLTPGAVDAVKSEDFIDPKRFIQGLIDARNVQN